MEKMTDEEIIRELSAMSVKQIRNIQKRYEKMFPADKHFLTMCTMVIAEKEEQRRECTPIFPKKNRSKLDIACSDVAEAVGFEPTVPFTGLLDFESRPL